MNVFKFEFRRSLTSLFGWTVAMLACISIFMQAMYPIYENSVDDIMIMMNSFPKEFLAAFGFSEEMFSFGGFYAFSFTYLTLLGVMFASSVTLQVFAREKRSHCQEFLYAKPLKRSRIFAEKLAAVLAILLISNGLIIGWSAAVTIMEGEKAIVGHVVLASLSVLFTELLFMAIIILYSIQARRVRTISGASMAFAFGGYILSAMEGIIDKVEMRYIAPFKYFNPLTAVTEGRYEVKFAVTAALIFVVVMIIAGLRYCRKDIRN